MVARILNLCGLSLGREEDIVPAAPDNPDGFWENRRFQEVNERLLGLYGGGWDRAIQAADQPDSQSETLARAIAGEMSGTWGWKDPRSSLLLPFWRRIFPGLRVIVCVRDPLEVVLSLRKRNNFSYESALALWYDYNRAIFEATDAEDRLAVHFSAFFLRPEEETRRLADYAGLAASDDVIGEAASTVKRDLRHSQFPTSTLIDAEMHPSLLALYSQLSDEAGWPLPELESFRGVTIGDLQGRLLNRPLLEARVLERDLRVLEKELRDCHALLAQYGQQIEDDDRQMRQWRDACEFRDVELAAARTTIQTLEEAVSQEREHSRTYGSYLDALRRERDDLATQATASAEEITRLRGSLREAENEASRMQNDLSSLTSQLSTLWGEHQNIVGSRGGKLLTAWWRLRSRNKR
jgi:hypothetical protein